MSWSGSWECLKMHTDLSLSRLTRFLFCFFRFWVSWPIWCSASRSLTGRAHGGRQEAGVGSPLSSSVCRRSGERTGPVNQIICFSFGTTMAGWPLWAGPQSGPLSQSEGEQHCLLLFKKALYGKLPMFLSSLLYFTNKSYHTRFQSRHSTQQ